MSDQTVATLSTDEEIPCMLLPMIGHTLLVPTTCVAEMSAVRPLDQAEEAPKWLMGFYNWRGTKVPVISVEAINGSEAPELNMDGRIAVLNNTGVNTEVRFIAIHTQGIPRMARISDTDITENAEKEKRDFDAMAVKVGLEEFYLPDITAMEMAYNEIASHVK